MVIKLRLKWVLAALAVLIAGIVLLAYYLHPSEEKRIRAVFHSLTEAVSRSGSEGFITAAGGAKDTARNFADEVTFDIPDAQITGSFTREELSMRIFQARNMFSSLTLSIYDLEFERLDDTGASVSFTAMLTGQLTHRQEPLREVRQLSAGLIKDRHGDWKLQNIRVDEVLRK